MWNTKINCVASYVQLVIVNSVQGHAWACLNYKYPYSHIHYDWTYVRVKLSTENDLSYKLPKLCTVLTHTGCNKVRYTNLKIYFDQTNSDTTTQFVSEHLSTPQVLRHLKPSTVVTTDWCAAVVHQNGILYWRGKGEVCVSVRTKPFGGFVWITVKKHLRENPCARESEGECFLCCKQTQVYGSFLYAETTITGHVYLDMLEHFLQQDGALPTTSGTWRGTSTIYSRQDG
jgi:hypothetical protein